MSEKEQNEQSTISEHGAFDNFVSEGLRIGSHIVGAKSHGKTRLMFSIAEQCRNKKMFAVKFLTGRKLGFIQLPRFQFLT